MNQFVAVDVETANEDLSSICQIGLVEFHDGQILNTFKTLINPRSGFSRTNIRIHNITPQMVADSPCYSDIFPELAQRLTGKVFACYSTFDINALSAASAKYNLPPLECNFLDILTVARHTWPEYKPIGYQLKNVAAQLCLPYTPHDALEDARIAGMVLHKALETSKTTLSDWTEPRKRMRPPASKPTPNPDGKLFGQVVAFTGDFLYVTREQVTQLALEAGCEVKESVTLNTTLLVADGYFEGTKFNRAKELIGRGHPIRIISEKEFLDLIDFEIPPDTETPERGNTMSNSPSSQPQIVRFESSYVEPYPVPVMEEVDHRRTIERAIHYYDDSESAEVDDLKVQLILENSDEASVRVVSEAGIVGYLSPSNSKKYRAALQRLGLQNVIGQCDASVRGGRVKSSGEYSDFVIRLDIDLENLRTAQPLFPRAAAPTTPPAPSDEIAALRSRAAAVKPAPVQPVTIQPAPSKAQPRRTIGQGFYQALTKKHTWQEWLALLFIITLIMTLLNLGR